MTIDAFVENDTHATKEKIIALFSATLTEDCVRLYRPQSFVRRNSQFFEVQIINADYAAQMQIKLQTIQEVSFKVTRTVTDVAERRAVLWSEQIIATADGSKSAVEVVRDLDFTEGGSRIKQIQEFIDNPYKPENAEPDLVSSSGIIQINTNLAYGDFYSISECQPSKLGTSKFTRDGIQKILEEEAATAASEINFAHDSWPVGLSTMACSWSMVQCDLSDLASHAPFATVRRFPGPERSFASRPKTTMTPKEKAKKLSRWCIEAMASTSLFYNSTMAGISVTHKCILDCIS
ncbi:hypothetical protein TruAng_000705 [Truncatella angustata]|nr:hypothetical protein TruAng_000705 [Truncatella angustata]